MGSASWKFDPLTPPGLHHGSSEESLKNSGAGGGQSSRVPPPPLQSATVLRNIKAKSQPELGTLVFDEGLAALKVTSPAEIINMFCEDDEGFLGWTPKYDEVFQDSHSTDFTHG